jgi:ParB family chromosome partitioning protein
MKFENAKIRDGIGVHGENNASSRTSILSNRRRSEISYLNTDQLIPYRKQSRRIFDEAEIKNLASTIEEHGIRQPLTVLRTDFNNPKFEVISGERRLRAAKLIGLKNVPCIIIEDSEKAEEIALIENIQRQDLHPIEIANSLKMLVDKLGWGGQTVLKNRIGLSNSQISELIKLTELSKEVQAVILEENFRGYENFRDLFLVKTDEEKINHIKNYGKGKTKRSPTASSSVLRLSFKNDELKVQKSALAKLDDVHREIIKNKLLEIIKEIECNSLDSSPPLRAEVSPRE